MRAAQYRDMDRHDLDSRLQALEKEAFDLRIEGAQGRMTNSSRLKQVRAEIARVKTVLRERELGLR